MYLHGFSIESYRSFGEATQAFSPTGKMNVIIGKNNAGKSNVLRTLVYILPSVLEKQTAIAKPAVWDSEIDTSRFSKKAPRIGLWVPRDELPNFVQTNRTGPQIDSFLRRFFQTLGREKIEGLWFYKSLVQGKWQIGFDETAPKLWSTALPGYQLEEAAVEITGGADHIGEPGGIEKNAHRIMNLFNPFRRRYNTVLVPATRSTQFENKQGDSIESHILYSNGIANFGGAGLVERLSKLQNPTFVERENAKRFRVLTEFVRAVVGNNSATIQISHDKTEINLEIDGAILPLANYGSGIEQIIILAAAATALEKHIFCVEEPETNLHPEYQIRVLDYLRDKTDNQYFVTTHSSNVIDLDNRNIFSVKLHRDGSHARKLLAQNDQYEVVFDLGYRPSDLAQCNSIIWVEGPSDRIYLKAALEHQDPSLIEGVDYSIMFYGGRLLSHLTADERQVEDFIVLTQMNRRSAIIIDSDRSSDDARINATKRRIAEEFERQQLFVWITHGREIENYVDPAGFREIVNAFWPERATKKGGRYDDMCKLQGEKTSGIDKVRVAHEVVDRLGEIGFRFDWYDQVNALAAFIKSSR